MRATKWLSQYDVRKEVVLVGLVLAAVLTPVVPSRAQYIVFDPTNLVENALTAAKSIETVEQLVKQVQQYEQQIQQYKRTYDSLVGSRPSIKKLAGLALDAELKQRLPTGISSMVSDYIKGGTLNGVMATALKDMKTKYKPLDQADFQLANSRGEEIAAYQDAVAKTQIGAVSASKAIDDTNTFADRQAELADQIDSCDDMKCSVDLGNKLMAETNYLLSYSLQMQAQSLGHSAAQDQLIISRVSQTQRDLARAKPDAQGRYSAGLY